MWNREAALLPTWDLSIVAITSFGSWLLLLEVSVTTSGRCRKVSPPQVKLGSCPALWETLPPAAVTT